MSVRPVIAAALMLSLPSAWAADGRLLATPGLLSIDGTAGGGLVPWATLAGYGEAGQFGGSVGCQTVRVDDFSVDGCALAAAYGNRIELSLSTQKLRLDGGPSSSQRIVGAKVRLAGDLVYGAMPQLSLGVQSRRQSGDFVQAGGPTRAVDVVLSATKAWIDGPFHRVWLANLSLRSTRFPLAGFIVAPGDRSLTAEASLAAFITPTLALGAEWRQLGEGPTGDRSRAWRDVFIGWFPNKRVQVTAAWVALTPNNSGAYLQAQVNF